MGHQASDSITHTVGKTNGVRGGCVSLNTPLYNNQPHAEKPMCFSLKSNISKAICGPATTGRMKMYLSL